MTHLPAPAFLIQQSNIILVINGKSHTISKSTHIAYDKILDALKKKEWSLLPDLIEHKTVITQFSQGRISIDNNKVYWKGSPFHNSLATRMISMYQDGFSIDPMVNFMDNLMNNPSKRSVDQLYGFLEKNSLPITEDGCFLAYKRVKPDYTDVHTGTINNTIGEIVAMERNLVDDNPDTHCSSGLHFCSESYLANFGNTDWPVMILKINPADVVSIPADYDGAKGRCSRYEVIAEVAGNPKDAFTKSVDTRHPVSYTWPTFSQLYDLVRVHGGQLEFSKLTLDAATRRRNQNATQKKAILKIVKTGTNISA